ncbi:MAG: riboflavin synthase [Actinomycetota bacterium]
MFTGLIEDVGEVEALEVSGDGARLRIATRLGAELAPGDSIAVNGVCLTAAEADDGGFSAEAVNQTLRVTSLGPLDRGDRVNLELPLRASDRLGGHLVQGHVDGTGEVAEAEDDGFARRLRLRVEPQLLRYVVDRGSLALDGVSLTVSALGDDWLEVSLVPETLERTTLGEAGPGRRVNVECDVLGKYVERLMSTLKGTGKV